MADWDADSPRLRQNLTKVLHEIRDSALRRDVPSLEAARQWQSGAMAGLEVPQPEYAGRFRGERGIRTERVGVADFEAVRPGDVAGQLAQFERRLQRAAAALDERYPAGHALDADGLAAVLDLCAWSHSEWVRIHPFVNGNGRTARMWANLLLMRYGLPPVVRLRPRPDSGYGAAARQAMGGDWKPTAAVFRKMLLDLSPPSRRP